MAARVKKWVKKMKILTDGLELPENCSKPECYAHCWKAYLIGYNLVIQKIALKYNPDFSRFFFVKLVHKPVFCPYFPRVAF